MRLTLALISTAEVRSAQPVCIFSMMLLSSIKYCAAPLHWQCICKIDQHTIVSWCTSSQAAQHTTKVSCVLAEGLFDLDSIDFQQEDNCRCVPMQSQVIVDLMGITITRVDHDVIAVLPLESGGNDLRVLLVAERDLQRWGLVDRRFAARAETSMPRKKDGKVSMTYSLRRLEKAYKGASSLLLCHFCCQHVHTLAQHGCHL